MANIKSKKKRILTNEKANARNRKVKSDFRTAIRRTNEAVAQGNSEEAVTNMRVASRKLDKAVSKGVIHKNNASNKKSAMAQKVNKLAA